MRFPLPDRVRSPLGTARRLFIAFALLVSTFAAASYLTLAIEPEPIDVRAVCEEAVARLRETRLLEDREVSVSGGARVEGHPHKLRQVVLNLVKNAAEAESLPEGGAQFTVRLPALPPGRV